MYKVILVDDEPWSIIDMNKSLNWEQFNFEVIKSFKDSKQAMETLRHEHIDVVFTDIRMPILSGLDLINLIKKENINTTCVILSGFTEFEYAREAVSLGAFDYCLKPLSRKKGNEVLLKLQKFLDKKQQPIEQQNLNKKTNNELFNKILNYINLNLHNKIFLDDLSIEFGLSKSYICKLFSKYMDSTYSQYLLQKRMEYAKTLLIKQNWSLSEIANKVGFSDIFYFSRSFKKYYGESPTSFIISLNAK